MLDGISPVVGPGLLAVLCSMGHGDEIVLADAHFPGHSTNDNVLRADGVDIPSLLDGILPLFPLDPYVDSPVAMMAAVPGDSLDPGVEDAYRAVLDRHRPGTPQVERVDRFAFYDRTNSAFAVVMSGDVSKYGNVILKKGLVGAARG